MEKQEKTIRKLMENYKNMERSLVEQLLLETPNHPLTTGTFREAVWRSLFETMIPKKYCMEQGVFIIDSFGGISNEVDLAVFDEMYTPYIFNYGKIKFIPIEAVAIVVQCKSKDTTVYKELQNWVGSIKILRTSLDSACRVMQGMVDNTVLIDNGGKKRTKSQTSSRPIQILCTTKKGKVSPPITQLFDIILSIEEGHLRKSIPYEGEDLSYWYSELNHYALERYKDDRIPYKEMEGKNEKMDRTLKELRIEQGEKENVIMSLTFQLNQLLMILNNPMLFPHRAYAKMFQDCPDSGAVTE